MSQALKSTASDAVLMAELHKLSDAGAAVVHIRSREPLRAALALRKHMVGSGTPYHEWNIIDGFRRFTKENFADYRVTGDSKDFIAALTYPLEELRKTGSAVNADQQNIHFFVYVEPQKFIENNAFVQAHINHYAAVLPSTNVCTIFITSDIPLPEIQPGIVLSTNLSTPSTDELIAVLDRIITDTVEAQNSAFADGSELTEEDYVTVANMGLGLSLYEFETYAALAVVNAGEAKMRSITLEHMLAGIAEGKTSVVRQSEILELAHAEDISNVGGMQRFKDWLGKRATGFTPEAAEWGVERPKGVVLVGVPGTGKSLIAKVTSSILNVPLVRLDFGRVFAKYVGDSESRVRSALKMVEDMAPVVLFVDEIDKGLGGSGGTSDGGISGRVLGTFLTWLQECKAPVFTVVTANRVNGLPPELLRRGRFDAIFSVGMPNRDERLEVLDIHLRKRGRDVAEYSAEDISEFQRASEGYVPAEIESAVKDAIVEAWNDDGADAVEMRHITQALAEMVPMSKSHKEAMDQIIAWAKDNATPVSLPEKPATEISSGARVITPGGRRVSRAR